MYILILAAYNTWNSLEIFSYLLFKDTVPFAVQYLHFPYSNHKGIIYESAYNIQRIHKPLTPYINVWLEVKLPLCNPLRLYAHPLWHILYRCRVFIVGYLLHICLRLLAYDASYRNTYPVAANLHHLSHKVSPLYLHFVTNFEFPFFHHCLFLLQSPIPYGRTFGTFCQPLLFPLLPLKEFLHLSLYLAVCLASFPLLHRLVELLQLLAGSPCLLFLCLCLLDGLYCCLNLAVGLVYYLLCLPAGLFKYLFLYRLDICKFFFIFFSYALKSAVCVLYSGKFLVQSPSVTGNLPQLFLHIHISGTGIRFCHPYYMLWKTYLPGQFKSKGVAWKPHLQFIERLYFCHIKEHCTVYCPVHLLCIKLEVCIVCGNYPKHTLYLYVLQYSQCYGTTRCRLCSCSELIYKHQRVVCCLLQHLFHVCKVGTIGTQIIFKRLLITYIYKDIVKYPELAHLACRNQHTPLEHILQHPHSFKTYRFSACIGA